MKFDVPLRGKSPGGHYHCGGKRRNRADLRHD
jgi:hypothetical protein